MFATAAQESSFTRAASRLGVPRSTVSRRIAQLEQELGVRLFHRTTRRVRLSSAGESLFERVGPSLTSIFDSVEHVAEASPEPAGQLRITAPADLATSLLPPIVASFASSHPAVSVSVSVSNVFVDLVAEGFDCALRISTKNLADSSLVARRVGELKVNVYAAPGYLRERRVRKPADLERCDWVVFGSGAVRLTSGGEAATVAPRGRVETDDMLFAREAALCGAGVGVLPEFLVARDVSAGRLVRVLPRWTARSGLLWLVWPGGTYVPRKTLAFCSHLVTAMDERLGVR